MRHAATPAGGQVPLDGALLAAAAKQAAAAAGGPDPVLPGKCIDAAAGALYEALVAAIFCWVLVVVTRTDLEHRLIPDRLVLPGALVVLGLRTLDEPSLAWLLGGLGAGIALFLLVLAYPKGMGMGDVKLALFLGVGLGLDVVVALFTGFIAGAVPAIVLLVRHGTAARKQAIPLGPFLALGGVVALIAGDAIVDWYW